MVESVKPRKEEAKGEGMEWHQEKIYSNNRERNERSGIKVKCLYVCVYV